MVEECVAEYDYTAEDPLEMSFRKGDIVQVLEKNLKSGWWDAKKADGKRGFVPSTYFSSKTNTTNASSDADLYVCETRYDAEASNELTIHVGDRVKILKKNDQTGWWLGQSQRGKGWLPQEVNGQQSLFVVALLLLRKRTQNYCLFSLSCRFSRPDRIVGSCRARIYRCSHPTSAAAQSRDDCKLNNEDMCG
jgi:hypothetical protein